MVEESTSWKFECSSLRGLFPSAGPAATKPARSFREPGEDGGLEVEPDLPHTECEPAPNAWLFQILMD
jgi:hypothetical protein